MPEAGHERLFTKPSKMRLKRNAITLLCSVAYITLKKGGSAVQKNTRVVSGLVLMLCAFFMISGCKCCEHEESKLSIDYEFDGGGTFNAVQGTWSNKDGITYRGYMYYFSAYPDTPSLNWNNATLHSPADINSGNNQLQCYNVTEDNRRSLDFYCGGSAVTPVTPPTGTYTVTVDTTTFTFQNVQSQTIDAGLNNVYVPVVKLTMDTNGKVTTIEWQWWKKQNNSWMQPSNSELLTTLEDAGFEIGTTNWALGDRVRGDINLTTTGSVAPPSQNFTPGALRISYRDKAGYHYGFEWR